MSDLFLENIPATVHSHLSDREIDRLSHRTSMLMGSEGGPVMNPEKTNFYRRLIAAHKYLPRPEDRRLLTDDRLVKFNCHRKTEANFVGTDADVKVSQIHLIIHSKHFTYTITGLVGLMVFSRTILICIYKFL